MSANIKPVQWWRVPSPQLHLGKYNSIIVDQGELKQARASSNGDYHPFSESGVGVLPLAIIGTPLQIVELLQRQAKFSIVNQIKELPEIYVGISIYKPKDRFSGVFPVKQVAQDIIKFGLAVWGAYRDSPAEKLAKFVADLLNANKGKEPDGHALFLKVSYLPEDGMVKLGKGSVSFPDIQKHLLAHMATAAQ